MLLTVDVGNTETKLGCFEAAAGELTHTWRVTTDLRRTPDEYGALFVQLFATEGIDVRAIDAVAVASVVPKLDPVLAAACARCFDVTPQFLAPATQTLIPLKTAYPAESGADLVAAAIGAHVVDGDCIEVFAREFLARVPLVILGLGRKADQKRRTFALAQRRQNVRIAHHRDGDGSFRLFHLGIEDPFGTPVRDGRGGDDQIGAGRMQQRRVV